MTTTLTSHPTHPGRFAEPSRGPARPKEYTRAVIIAVVTVGLIAVLIAWATDTPYALILVVALIVFDLARSMRRRASHRRDAAAELAWEKVNSMIAGELRAGLTPVAALRGVAHHLHTHPPTASSQSTVPAARNPHTTQPSRRRARLHGIVQRSAVLRHRVHRATAVELPAAISRFESRLRRWSTHAPREPPSKGKRRSAYNRTENNTSHTSTRSPRVHAVGTPAALTGASDISARLYRLAWDVESGRLGTASLRHAQGPPERRACEHGPSWRGASNHRRTSGPHSTLVHACQFSARWGIPLAQVLDTVVEQAAHRRRHEGSVKAQLAGPATSSAILTCLPILGVIMGESMGAGALALLTTTPVGALLALVGTALTIAGREWTRRLSGTRDASAELDAAQDLDFFALCLRSGLPVVTAVAAVAHAGSYWSPVWSSIARRAWWGLPTTTVWSGTAGTPLADIAMRAERVNHSGARLADDVEAMAMELRTRLADSRSERAARSAVYITMPLACCFLPAFVVVGLVPVGIGLLSGMA